MNSKLSPSNKPLSDIFMDGITKRAMNIPIIMAYSWLLSKKSYRKEADRSIVSL